MKKEYIYLTINPDNKNVVKVGRTTKKPILRAKEMDRKSHNVNNWIVEKYWEVFDSKIAETIAHYCLQEYSVPSKRELFEIDKEEAIKIIDKNLTVFSCLMSKESIENNYFEQQNYVEKLHTKISELESQIATYQIADTELRAIIDDFRKDIDKFDNSESPTKIEILNAELRLIERSLRKKPDDEVLSAEKRIIEAELKKVREAQQDSSQPEANQESIIEDFSKDINKEDKPDKTTNEGNDKDILEGRIWLLNKKLKNSVDNEERDLLEARIWLLKEKMKKFVDNEEKEFPETRENLSLIPPQKTENPITENPKRELEARLRNIQRMLAQDPDNRELAARLRNINRMLAYNKPSDAGEDKASKIETFELRIRASELAIKKLKKSPIPDTDEIETFERRIKASELAIKRLKKVREAQHDSSQPEANQESIIEDFSKDIQSTSNTDKDSKEYEIDELEFLIENMEFLKKKLQKNEVPNTSEIEMLELRIKASKLAIKKLKK